MNTTILKGTYGYTKNQVQYKKSNIGKTVGTITGLGVSIPTINYNMKDMFKKLPTKVRLPLMGIMIASSTGFFRLLGEGVDAIINKVREKKVDKTAKAISLIRDCMFRPLFLQADKEARKTLENQK